MYPKAICHECEDSLNKFYCFRKVIIDTDRELKERLSVNIKVEDICKAESIYFDPNEEDSNEDFNEEDRNDGFNEEDPKEPTKSFNEEDPSDTSNEKDSCDDSINAEKKEKNSSKTCSECNVTFPSSTELWKHKRKNHVKPGICNICGVIVRSDNLKKHVRIHYQDTVSCKICKKKYKNAESLRSHLLIHKGLEFKCEICGKVSAVKSEHHRHMKSHKGMW